MQIREIMSVPVITIHPEMQIQDALDLMQKEHIRRLPIVGCQGHLMGIVSEKDLCLCSSPDSTYTDWEFNCQFRKFAVEQVMTREVITIDANASLEEAALKMIDHKISGLPVVEHERVIGMITETDLFKTFLELVGAREPGVWIQALLPDTVDNLIQLTNGIANIGGKLIFLGTFQDDYFENREICIKITGADEQSLAEAIKPAVERILDIRISHMDWLKA